MMDRKDIIIVIPAYNETKSINTVLKSLINEGYQKIVLIDDGSKIPLTDVVEPSPGVFLLRHVVNRGQGAALQTGHEFAKMLEGKYIVHFDADGQHDYKEIMEMVKKLETDDLDIILGTRFDRSKTKISNVPLKKKIVLRVGILFSFLLSNVALSDTHNGFRIIKKDSVDKFKISMNRFEHASEIIDHIGKNNVKYKEHPVTITYTADSIENGQKISNSINIVKNFILDKLSSIY